MKNFSNGLLNQSILQWQDDLLPLIAKQSFSYEKSAFIYQHLLAFQELDKWCYLTTIKRYTIYFVNRIPDFFILKKQTCWQQTSWCTIWSGLTIHNTLSIDIPWISIWQDPKKPLLLQNKHRVGYRTLWKVFRTFFRRGFVASLW